MMVTGDCDVYACDDGGRLTKLWWNGGALRETLIADPRALGTERSSQFSCECLGRSDIDADGRLELLLGGDAAGEAVVLLCHEDGGEARFTPLSETGSVVAVAAGQDGGTLVLSIRSILSADLSASSGQDRAEAAHAARLLVAHATSEHLLSTLAGPEVSCPVQGGEAPASLAVLSGGELAVAWRMSSPGPESQSSPQSLLATYRFANRGLEETASRSLAGELRLLGSAPASVPNRGDRLLTVVAPGESPGDATPGVYIFDRRGAEADTDSLAVWWGAGARGPAATPDLNTAISEDFTPLVSIQGAGDGCTGEDGTLALWGATQASSQNWVSHVGVMKRDLGWPTPLDVPDDAYLMTGEVLDLDGDGSQDLLGIGTLGFPSKRHVAFVWLGCEPGRPPSVLELDTELDMTARAGDRVYATRQYSDDPLVVLAWRDGELQAMPVVDFGALPEPGPLFAHWCLECGDVDSDGAVELILGGYCGVAPTVYVCHEDGAQGCFTSLDEVGWVGAAAASTAGGTLVLGMCRSLLPADTCFSDNHLSAHTMRLVTARVTAQHQVTATLGQDVLPPVAAEVSEAALAFLTNGELVATWRTGDMPQGLEGARRWFDGRTLVAYAPGPNGLKETARLAPVTRFIEVVPSSGPGQSDRLVVYVSAKATPEGWDQGWGPGACVVERRGPKTDVVTFSIRPR